MQSPKYFLAAHLANRRRLTALFVLATVCTVCACHQGADTPLGADAASGAATKLASVNGSRQAEDKGGGVTLTTEDIVKLGLKTTVVVPGAYTDEVEGYGVVLPHEAVATAVAELMMAEATARQSHSALARQQRLENTPGALSADVEEAAVHQAAVDDAALTLAQRRLATVVGMNPPWLRAGNGSPLLQDLASGKRKMVRVTFPLGAFTGASLPMVRVSPLGANRPGATWFIKTVWAAPADSNIPGRSFFGIWQTQEASEGERLRAWGPSSDQQHGVIIPASALVMDGGKYWCYVEKHQGRFVRIAIDIAAPVPQGYFVTVGVAAGDTVVTTAAGLLLAKETGSSADPD